MLLTIGMIVKNEEKYLDRCLSAMKPILDNIDSELIIADTGSTDKTVEIAKKYTDNVFYFEWINDFAAARNSTLEKAKGEWYLYVDADEIFQSVDDIIRFFRSGEYKKYEAAAYYMRSFTDIKANAFVTSTAIRFIKIYPGMRFEGVIHELPNKDFPERKILADVALHYGYNFEDEKEREKKYLRNKSLLMERFNNTKDPKPQLYLEVAESMLLGNDLGSVSYYLDNGIEKALALNDPCVYVLYSRKAGYLHRLDRVEEIIELCYEYFKLPPIVKKPIAMDIDIYFIGAITFPRLRKFKETIEYGSNALRLYSLYKKGTLNKFDLPKSLVFASDQNAPLVLASMVHECALEKQLDLAADYLKKIPVREYYGDRKYVEMLLGDELEVMRGRENYRRVEDLYNEFDIERRAVLNAYMRNEILMANVEQRKKLFIVLKKICVSDKELMTLVDVAEALDKGADYANIMSKIPENELVGNYDLLYFLMKNKSDVMALVSSRNFDAAAAAKSMSAHADDFYDVIEKYPLETVSGNGLRGMLNLYEKVMLISAEEKRPVNKLFALWGQAGLCICEAEGLGAEALSGQLFGAVMGAEAVLERQRGDIRSCMNALIALLRQYPEAKNFVMAFRNEIKNG